MDFMDREVALIGLSHKTAPIEMREQIAVDQSNLVETLRSLCAQSVIDEAVIISTCNRVEIVASGSDSDIVRHRLAKFLEEATGKDASWVERYCYQLCGDDAVRQVFRVASSLDSLVVGEPQIVGQVKDAYDESRKAGFTGPLLNRTFHQAFHVAKRVRNETAVAQNAVSISFAGVELARKVFGHLNGKRVLVIGAGEMGTLAVRHLLQAGADSVDIANRSKERAVELADELGGVGHGLDSLPSLLEAADIVITSTGSQRFLINKDLLKPLISKRKYRPVLLVDIAVPRDVDPRCESLRNVYLFDVDDLDKVVKANLRQRQAEAQKAETIVEEEIEELNRWISTTEAVPTIVQLREKLNELKEAELDRMVRANRTLSDETVETAERLANSLINKILHEPTISLREATENDPTPLIQAVRSLFQLSEEDAQPVDTTNPEPEPGT
jgi:glutamyl-tRNA reductase